MAIDRSLSLSEFCPFYRYIRESINKHSCVCHSPEPMMPLTDYPTLRLFLDGMLLMMALYAFSTFIWHRKRMYAWYGLYLVGMIANLYFNDQVHSLTEQHAPERDISLSFWLEFAVQTVAFVCYIRFTTALLDLRHRDPVSRRITNYMLVVLLIGQFIDTFYFWVELPVSITQWRGPLTNLNRYAMTVLVVLLVWRILRLRDVVTSFFIVGTGIFTAGSILAVTMHIMGWDARITTQPFSFPLIPMQLGIVIESLLFTIAISFLNRQTERQKIRYQAQLIEQLRENERKQARLNGLRDEIARDLHDEMGSQLSSISILSQTTTRLVTDERVRQRLGTIGQTTRQVMESMREIVWSLNSSSDSMQHVGVRIRETALALLGDSPTKVHFDLPQSGQPLGLSGRHRRELFLIAKECLTNIVRHARAKHVRIYLQTETNRLKLVISDDGIGFSTDTESSGLGLASMQQRAERLNARLSILSACGAGSTITVDCPIGIEHPVHAVLLSQDYD